jgi:hypothetical protein
MNPIVSLIGISATHCLNTDIAIGDTIILMPDTPPAAGAASAPRHLR